MLAASPSFRQRVTFVAVCQARVLARTLLNDGCLETDYVDVLEALSHDAVVDVRIGLSRLVGLLCGECLSSLSVSCLSDMCIWDLQNSRILIRLLGQHPLLP